MILKQFPHVDGHPAGKTLGVVHGDRPDRVRVKMVRDLQHRGSPLIMNAQGLVLRRQAVGEFDFHDRTADRGHPTGY